LLLSLSSISRRIEGKGIQREWKRLWKAGIVLIAIGVMVRCANGRQRPLPLIISVRKKTPTKEEKKKKGVEREER